MRLPVRISRYTEYHHCFENFALKMSARRNNAPVLRLNEMAFSHCSRTGMYFRSWSDAGSFCYGAVPRSSSFYLSKVQSSPKFSFCEVRRRFCGPFVQGEFLEVRVNGSPRHPFALFTEICSVLNDPQGPPVILIGQPLSKNRIVYVDCVFLSQPL